MERGYVKLWRKIEDSAVFDDAELLRLWVWLLVNATRVGKKLLNGFHVPPGSLVVANDRLAARFQCAKSTIHRRLHILEEQGMVKLKAERTFTVVSICNWKTYQADSNIASNAGRTPAEHASNAGRTPAERASNAGRTPAEREQEREKDKRLEDISCHAGTDQKTNGHESQGYPVDFEAFWLSYPRRDGRRRGKQKAFGIWRQAIQPTERQALVTAAKSYAGSNEARDGFAKDPERFLKAGWWKDWLESAEPTAEANGSDMTGKPLTAEQIANLKPGDIRG